MAKGAEKLASEVIGTMRKQILNMSLLVLLGAYLGPIASLTLQEACAAEALRQEIGKPLQAAEELAKGHHYKEAQAKINEADAVSNKTAYESLIIERMRGAVAQEAGDSATAAKAFETLIDSGKLPPVEQQKMVEAVAFLYYQSKNYAAAVQWAQRYVKEGGSDPQIHTLLAQSYYLNNDCSGVANQLQPQMATDAKANRAPAEESLQLLASCYQKQNDTAGYVSALETLVTYYPKKSYWADLLHRLETKQGFSDRLDLDLYRLKRASGDFGNASDYMEMAQLSLQAGYPVEAQKVIDEGFTTGVLGTGPDAGRQQRLKNMAVKNANQDQQALAQNESQALVAGDGTGLINVGFAYVLNGQVEKGISLMQTGIAKGNLKRPDEAELHLGIAYYLAGQKAKAIETFKNVQGRDGTGDLARLWAIRTQSANAG